MASPDPDVYVDVTDTMERKVGALREHASQLADPDGIGARLREWGAATAEAGGLEPGRYAEAFRRVDTA